MPLTPETVRVLRLAPDHSGRDTVPLDTGKPARVAEVEVDSAKRVYIRVKDGVGRGGTEGWHVDYATKAETAFSLAALPALLPDLAALVDGRAPSGLPVRLGDAPRAQVEADSSGRLVAVPTDSGDFMRAELHGGQVALTRYAGHVEGDAEVLALRERFILPPAQWRAVIGALREIAEGFDGT